MASILDRYGIKEVADVTFYKIQPDGSIGAPVLYLDTLKVSTIEQTAENTSARGGKGNPELITWDYGKEITVTLEDALFSAKSMAIMFGSVNTDGDAVLDSSASILKTARKADVVDGKVTIHGESITIPTQGTSYYNADGTTGSSTSYDYVTFPLSVKDVSVINISAETFPGTYYITVDTYARRETDGLDEFFQFIIPKAKVQSEVTLTMEAEGDPSTFSMNLRVLRPSNDSMMKLVKYNLDVAQG